MAGLQWKQHLGSDIAVTISDMSPEAIKSITEYCKRNNFDVTPENTLAHINPDGMSSVDGEKKIINATNRSVEIVQKDVNIVMYQRQFNVM